MKTITTLERELVAKQAEGRALLTKTSQAAEAENRAFTDEERAELDRLAGEGRDIKARIGRLQGDESFAQQLAELTGDLTPARAQQPMRMLSMGEQFVTSPEYRDYFGKGHHKTNSAWRSPSIELFPNAQGLYDMRAATLTTDSASGGALILPDWKPGILPLQFKRLVIADLLGTGTTDSNTISYMKELVFTNAAAAVAEGAAKPESALTFEQATDPVRKLAHWLPVTEEMLEDVPQIRSYIDSRLRLGVQIVEEDELLNGSGIAPHILGLRNRVGLAADVVRAASESNADAFFRQTMAIYTGSFLMPDGYVMNPTDWATTALMKTTTGEYMAGGPFAPLPATSLWGLPVAVTPSIPAGVGLVGAFKSATQVYRKGGIRVEASNSHQDYFIKNLVAIRAEERLALAVYRPAAIGEVTSLGTPTLLMARGGGELGEGGSRQIGEGEREEQQRAAKKEKSER